MPRPQTYDLVLQAAVYTANGRKIGAERSGVILSQRGFVHVDSQMRTSVPHIFAVGDIVGSPMQVHRAAHETRVVAGATGWDGRANDAQLLRQLRIAPAVCLCQVVRILRL